MWSEEDNNPYDGTTSTNPPSPVLPSTYNQWSTSAPANEVYYADQFGPNVHSDDGFGTHEPSSEVEDRPVSSEPALEERFTSEDDADFEASRVLPKKGGYESRVEQFLYEHPETNILISDAGTNPEGAGNHIVYTIRIGDIECRRRYSEFVSLRKAMVNFHPTLIIPPIPDKHKVTDYITLGNKEKVSINIIELRKRMLALFLNRCRQMREVREDGVWWKFLDPNASWSEVTNSHPISSIPKNILKAPPLDVANPTPGHAFLPIPTPSTKLRPESSHYGSGNTPPPTRFPLPSTNLSEEELDPYFFSFEQSSQALETLLQGPMETSTQRLLSGYNSYAIDLAELGARYNAFSLSETPDSLNFAIEKIGQAVDRTCANTKDLSHFLNLSYAEPMRENAQFAAIVRNVIRYRVLKRLQQGMTEEKLRKERAYLAELEQSDAEAQRIEHALNNPSIIPSTAGIVTDASDRNSIDSDFPPTRVPPASAPPTTTTMPSSFSPPGNPLSRTLMLGISLTEPFRKLNHSFRGVVDSDPEKNRRNQITKTRETIANLEMALKVAETDVKHASEAVLKDLRRFQGEKEADLKRYMIAFATDQIEWANRSKSVWEEAKGVVAQINTSGTVNI